eukprot:scaffold6909_cov125-Isochrysis_galbana.AAC.1
MPGIGGARCAQHGGTPTPGWTPTRRARRGSARARARTSSTGGTSCTTPTRREMAKRFFTGHEYSEYLDAGGKPFKEDIFYESKCKCIEQSRFEECSCPVCTCARETVRDWQRQRAQWYRERDAAGGVCECGACEKGGAWREASRSFAALRAFLHAGCGKESLSELVISRGPKSCEKVEMYRRQCCRVPLPEIADALKAVAKADELAVGAAEGDKKVAKAAEAAERAAAGQGYSVEEVRQLADCKKCGLVSGRARAG